MEVRLQKMEKESQKRKQSTQEGEVKENSNLRDNIKQLEENLTNNLALNSLESKLDIKPIKEEMNKLIGLDHENNKTAMNLIIFGIKENKYKEFLPIVKEELKHKSQIETTCVIEEKRMGKITKYKYRLIHVKVSSNYCYILNFHPTC
jgi:hypothetical protein